MTRTCTDCHRQFTPPRKVPDAPRCHECYERHKTGRDRRREQAVKALVRAAQGQWLRILPALGIADSYLTKKHGPCPGCKGTDRFRFDDKDGRGSWVCNGGGELQAGDGLQLLEHVNGINRGESLRRVAALLGVDLDAEDAPLAAPAQAPERATAPPPQSPTQGYALALWARAERDDATVAGHPYATEKNIGWAAGAGRARASGRLIGRGVDCIVIPVRDLATGTVRAVECISEHRDEAGKFLRQSFGPKSAGALPLGHGRRTSERHVCEGWATGVQLWRRLGDVAVYVAFGAGRLRPVAEWVEAHAPGGPVFIAKEAP